MEEILKNQPGRKAILLGNEAIVRGALESGVDFVSTYPGTPASEIGNIFFRLFQNKDYKGYFEFSTNEKVALEAGVGASFSGLKTLVAMKNFGLNVCLDALFPFVYTGSKGPTVIIVADDPSCHSSAQSEENSRGVLLSTHIPVLEPADPQECKDFVKLGYQISEKFKIPVVVRTTTRVAHQKMPVMLGKLKTQNPELKTGRFIKNPHQFVTLPPRVLEMKKELLEKIEKIRKFSEKSPINRSLLISNSGKIGVITSGISYLNVMEALQELKISLPVLKLGFFNPLPEEKIKRFIRPLKRVLVVEELEPFLENEVARLAKEANCKLEVVGKKLLPEVGELKPEQVILAISKMTNVKYKIQDTKYKIQTPKRSPQLCPGCPYWLVISAVKKALRLGSGQVHSAGSGQAHSAGSGQAHSAGSGQAANDVIFGGEIGCYMLFGNSPINLQDYLSCMGSSVGIAHGIKKSTGQKLITFVGDSSFFHAGIPAIINTVFNKSNPLIIILNNETTAMTGHQPHPGAPAVPNGIRTMPRSARQNLVPSQSSGINIENIVRACGVKYVKTIDQINQEEFSQTVKEFLEKDEVSVIIAKHPCIFVAKKQ